MAQKLYGTSQKSSLAGSIIAQNYFKITPKSKFNITKPGHAKKTSYYSEIGSSSHAVDILHQTEQTPQNAMLPSNSEPPRPAAKTSIDYNTMMKADYQLRSAKNSLSKTDTDS